MNTAVGIAAFLIALSISIGLHEAGHFFIARRHRVNCPSFTVGIGPKIWARKSGGTLYTLRLFPLLGYVKLQGMVGPAPAGDSGKPLSKVGQLIADLRANAREGIDEQNDARSFYRLRPWKKIQVMSAGVITNLALAFLLVILALTVIGPAKTTLEIAGVADPARSAGIITGDRITAVSGQKIFSWEQLREIVVTSPGKQLQIQIEREGKQIQLPLQIAKKHVTADGGNSDGTYGSAGLESRVMLSPMSVNEATGYYFQSLGSTIYTVATLPVRVVEMVKNLFPGAAPDTPVLTGFVGVTKIAGDIASQEVSGWQRVGNMLLLIASINLALAIFNLLPFPPFDGGHIAAALVDVGRGTYRFLRRLPPVPAVDAARLAPVSIVVITVFILLTFVLIAADIVRIIGVGVQ